MIKERTPIIDTISIEESPRASFTSLLLIIPDVESTSITTTIRTSPTMGYRIDDTFIFDILISSSSLISDDNIRGGTDYSLFFVCI